MLRYVAGSDQGCQYGANNVQAFPRSPKKTQRLRRSLYTVYTIHHRSGGESDPVLGGALAKWQPLLAVVQSHSAVGNLLEAA
ncbi:hypothetical protein WJX75_002569 [Coccomyxa subellipsoidea]|uniref:Uncharacterized protein n=1 Tax=Coccomyxa subellipsoidea TaxID=248742 RepID=A0ABR2YV81_9CHLO